MKLCKLLLSVVGATVLLGALVSSASANRLSASSQRLTATWTRSEFVGGFGTTVCNLTLEGTTHSATITKSAGTLIGFITRASVGPCSAGSATVLTSTLPWHVLYESFTGELPSNIRTVNTQVIGSSFSIRESGGIICLARSTTTEPSRGIYNLTGGRLTSVELGGTIATNCFGARGTLRGASATNTALAITLI